MRFFLDLTIGDLYEIAQWIARPFGIELPEMSPVDTPSLRDCAHFVSWLFKLAGGYVGSWRRNRRPDS
jgi:hypothetical protein